jgi:DNA-binding response OmpR family regulator
MDAVLSGRTILIVEDEPLIALCIVDIFRAAGASIEVAPSLAAAQELVENYSISAAVVDFGLGDGDAHELCDQLNHKHVPFVLHSAYLASGICCVPDAVVPKPADPKKLVEAVGHLLGRHSWTKSSRRSNATPS